MFKKPFKIKSQTQLKNSEKRKFVTDLVELFPALKFEEVMAVITSKDKVVRTKVTTFKDEDVEIYCINKIPMYFDIIDTGIKLPTVFMLWKFPHMLPTFTTNSTVFEKLRNGADLFFPGIYTKGLFSFEHNYKEKDPVCVNLIDNQAVVAVGISLVHGYDVESYRMTNQNTGKLIKIYHTAEDFLFKMNPDAVMVNLKPPDWARSEEGDCFEATENDISCSVADVKNEEPGDSVIIEDFQTEKDKNNKLLEYCFLKALKKTPVNSYPILPSTFYANHVLANVPEGEDLKIKKTEWRKFSNFLVEKSLEDLVQLEPLPKNEFRIAGVNLNHPQLREFVDPHNEVSVEGKGGKQVVEAKGNNKPVVQQVFSVTAATLPFFAKFGLKKHDELTRNDVRNHLNDYIKSEGLVHPVNPELVVCDPILYGILKGEEVVSRGNLLSELLEKMSVQHKVSNCGNGGTMLHKGKMPFIEFETCLRTGNKKVTLINNLECYGVNVESFSKELQHKAAASTTITVNVPGKKGPQIQVQGNQIAIAVRILKEKHNLHEKFMKGLEKAAKSKSKK